MGDLSLLRKFLLLSDGIAELSCAVKGFEISKPEPNKI